MTTTDLLPDRLASEGAPQSKPTVAPVPDRVAAARARRAAVATARDAAVGPAAADETAVTPTLPRSADPADAAPVSDRVAAARARRAAVAAARGAAATREGPAHEGRGVPAVSEVGEGRRPAMPAGPTRPAPRGGAARAPKVRAGAATRVLTGGMSVAATLAMVAGFATADARSQTAASNVPTAPGAGTTLASGAAGAVGAALAPPRTVVRVVIVPQAGPTAPAVEGTGAAPAAPAAAAVVAPPAAAPPPVAAPPAPAAAPPAHTSSGGS